MNPFPRRTRHVTCGCASMTPDAPTFRTMRTAFLCRGLAVFNPEQTPI